MSQKMDIQKKKCITPEFRVSFPNVFKAKSFREQEPKYSLTMLFDRKTDLKELKRAAHNAAVEKWGADKTKWPKGMKLPFRDGDDKPDLKGYAGTIFTSASSKQKPGLVDQRREKIIDEEQFYAGCYARAELIAFAYDNIGIGVSFSLQNVQKIRDGEKFTGRREAEDVFDEVEDASDNEENYSDDGDTEVNELGF